jgi:glycosyltransferase involved in cell wall biosynthesis
MRKAFSGHHKIRVVSVSPWVYERSTSSPILKELPQSVIFNGVNGQVFTHMPATEARSKLGLSGSEKIILHVTAHFSSEQTDLKNGRQLIALAKRFEGENVRFLVVGKYDPAVQVPSNVILMGAIHDQTLLAQNYAAADLVVVVSKRETFGMTVAEAMCCGTPVVGVSSGGSDSIALSQYAQFFPLGEVDAMEAAIREKWMDFKTEIMAQEISMEALRVFSADIMSKQYCDLYGEMI